MSVRNEARDGLLFVAAGLFAGLGNYAFQILASTRLSAPEFARFSGWLAHLAAAFIAAGLVQYAANFHPVPKRRRGYWLVGLNVLALLLSAAWIAPRDPLDWSVALTVVGLAAIQGWAVGQAQIRLDFRGIAFAQIANALVRLAVPLALGCTLGGFAFGVAFSYVPALWLLTAHLRRGDDVATELPPASSWAAPVVLAVAANLLPQFDLILMQHTQSPPDFDLFARASLFYKGIYFFVFIFAQWLLPRQIRGGGRVKVGQGVLALVGAATSGALALASPWIAAHVFHWAEVPSRGLVLLSCLHMSLLTLLFIFVQAECARGHLRAAVGVMGVLALEAALQLFWAWPAAIYLPAALALQFALLVSALRLTASRAD